MTNEEPKKPNLSLTRPWAIVIAAIVIGISIIVVATVVTGNDDDNTSSNNPANTDQNAAHSDDPNAIRLAENGVSNNAEWEPYSPYIQEFNGVEMVLVPTGCFMMGSTDEQITLTLQICQEFGLECGSFLFSDERPAHQQCFDEPFWIDRTEVTRAQYAQCVDDGVCTARRASTYSTRDDQPMNAVTWFQAQDYCTWRDARLPTEREWEYAARGSNNLIYPWGNDFVSDNVVYSENSGTETASVGTRPSGTSWVGALDMSGNVWEWMSSLYQDYEYDTNDGREDSENDTDDRVIRGGGFADGLFDTRMVARHNFPPNSRNSALGWRCVHSY